MDPNTALANAREASARLDASTGQADMIEAALDIAAAYRALDEWITRGGFLPADWTAGIR